MIFSYDGVICKIDRNKTPPRFRRHNAVVPWAVCRLLKMWHNIDLFDMVECELRAANASCELRVASCVYFASCELPVARFVQVAYIMRVAI